jgi:hypothetical protein
VKGDRVRCSVETVASCATDGKQSGGLQVKHDVH